MVDPLLMKEGAVIEPSEDEYELKGVIGCCGVETDDGEGGIKYVPQKIGSIPQMNHEQAIGVLEAAKKSWNVSSKFGNPEAAMYQCSAKQKVSLRKPRSHK